MAAAITPKTEVKVVTTVQVTGFVNNREEERVEIHYITLLEDGMPYQRGNVVVGGKEAIQALYAEMDAEIAKGLGFEDASRNILYAKVVSELV